MPTTFLAVLGYNSISIGGSSTTKWGSTRLRVALVLDNTGSMAQSGKLSALKTATKNLLTQLKDAASVDGDVYVSIIPFVKDVNVGNGVGNASWIDWSLTIPSGSTPSSSVGPGSNCPYSSGWNNNSACVTQPGGSTITNTIPSSGSNKGYICPTNSIGCYDSVAQTTTGTKVISSGWGASCGYVSNCSCSGSSSNKVCTQTTTTTTYLHTWFVDPSNWNGCVTDRGSNSAPGSNAGYDQTVTQPTTSIPETLFPAEQYSSCPQAMKGLNYDWSAMNTLVNNMQANGNTNQPIGLVWGWQSLVGGGPFTVPPMDSNYQYSQIIILLTDGLNTEDRWYNANQTAIDNRMYQNGNGTGTCANIKATGITIYAIQVNTGGDPTSTLLQNCASDSEQVLPADLGEPDRDHVSGDRHQPDQAETGEVAARRQPTKKPGFNQPGLPFYAGKTVTRRDVTKRVISPSPRWFRTACRSPWRDRHTARRSWWPWPHSPHRRSWRIRSAIRSPCRAT